MSIKIREMLNDDALAFLQVHHAAVRGIAAKDYPPEIDGRIVGIGALVLAKSELRACYVAPQTARRGVGSALMHELERIARDRAG